MIAFLTIVMLTCEKRFKPAQRCHAMIYDLLGMGKIKKWLEKEEKLHYRPGYDSFVVIVL